MLNEVTKEDYAIKAENFDKKLLAIRKSPYNLLFYGDYECLDEMISYLKENNYNYAGVMCPKYIGDVLESKFNYEQKFMMDFMEAREVTLESSNEVTKARKADLDDIYECVYRFFKDCGLPDTMTKEKLSTLLHNFRIIREDDKVISIATFTYDTESSFRISHVYTLPEYRGKHYAKKVVNYIKNEILSMGKIPTLNVDQKNPISNHLYASLGFKKVYSHGMYKIK